MNRGSGFLLAKVLKAALQRDPQTQAVSLVCLASLVLVASAPRLLDAVVFVLLASLVLISGRSLWKIGNEDERRFQLDLAAGFASWFLASVLLILFPAPDQPMLLVDFLYAICGGAWMLAASRQPHLSRRYRPVNVERRLTWPLVMFLAGGLYVYCSLLPGLLTPGSAGSGAALLTLAFNSYLTLRWWLLWRIAESERYLALYMALATGTGILTVQAFLSVSGVVPAEMTGALSLVAFPFFALAIRLPHAALPPEGGTLLERLWRAEISSGPFEHTLIGALVISVLHLTSYGLALSPELQLYPESLRSAHEIFLLGLLAALGALAMSQSRVWRQELRPLRRERQRAEKSLRQIHQDMLLMQERRQYAERPKASAEAFAEAFRSCPALIALTRWEDGRILEVNPASETLLGYTPEEMVGRTSKDLRMWIKPRSRQDLLRQLLSREVVRDFHVILRAKEGRELRGVVSAQAVSLRGEACLLIIMQQATEDRGDDSTAFLETEMAHLARYLSASRLEATRQGVCLIDADGVLFYRNPRAGELYGWSPEAIGQNVRELLGLRDLTQWHDGRLDARQVESRSTVVRGAGGRLIWSFAENADDDDGADDDGSAAESRSTDGGRG